MKYLPHRDIEAGPDILGGQFGELKPEKPKRKRKDWVYKSDYDHLKFKYNLLKWASVALVVGFLFIIKLAS